MSALTLLKGGNILDKKEIVTLLNVAKRDEDYKKVFEEMLKYNEKNPKDKFDWSIMESVSMCLPEKTAK
mgnify:CR=1 FL=1